jgi:hypothetical protein
MKIKPVLIGYGVFCAVNWAVGYMSRGSTPGQNALFDLNSTLGKFNVLSYVLPMPGLPVAASTPVASTFAPLPQPQVMPASSGTTTYFGP